MFFANAKSNFGAIFLLFYGIFRFFWKNSGFSYANQLWKIRILLYEIGSSLFAFVKHLDIYGNDNHNDNDDNNNNNHICAITPKFIFSLSL
jgi:hypothetical protein